VLLGEGAAKLDTLIAAGVIYRMYDVPLTVLSFLYSAAEATNNDWACRPVQPRKAIPGSSSNAIEPNQLRTLVQETIEQHLPTFSKMKRRGDH